MKATNGHPEEYEHLATTSDAGAASGQSGQSQSTAIHPPSPEITSSLLAAIVESSDDAIISSTLDGSITSWNKGAERIFGYNSGEIIGKSTSVLGSENAFEDPANVLDKIRRGDPVEHYETLRRHKDGSDIIVSLTVSPIRDASGSIIGASKVARDITSTRRAEQALRNTDKLALAGRMAASIAHEINNPLEAITNLLYLLQQEKLSEQGAHYLGMAQHELTRVSQIASQTLGFFRGATGPVHCQISEIVENAVSLHAGRLVVTNVTVETSFHTVPPLLCLQGEMRQVIVNLISNALDSISGKGRLLIRIRASSHPITSAKGLRLTVADTGLGMKQTTMRQIFEPFYTTKGSTGTGLGLWVTHQIVERHAGRITVRSSQTPLRHGTVFSIFFPYENPAFAGMDKGDKPPRLPGSTGGSGKFTSRGGEYRRTPFESGLPSTAYIVV